MCGFGAVNFGKPVEDYCTLTSRLMQVACTLLVVVVVVVVAVILKGRKIVEIKKLSSRYIYDIQIYFLGALSLLPMQTALTLTTDNWGGTATTENRVIKIIIIG